MPFLLIAATWLRRFAATIPIYAYVIAGLALALVLTAHGRARWHKRATVAEASLASVAAAQRAVNHAAAVTKARVETAQSAITKGADNANSRAHSDAGNATATLRLRIADLERAARARVVPGPGSPSAFPDAQIDLRLSFTDELALRSSCETVRIDHDSLIDWYAAQAAIDRTPQP